MKVLMKFLQLFCLAGVLAAALGAEPIGPGSLIKVLATVSDSALSNGPAAYTVTLNGGLPELVANTYYWIGLCDTSDTPCSSSVTTPSAQWYYDLDDQGTGVAGNDYVYGGQPEQSDANGPFQMSVTVGVSAVFDNTSDSSGYQSCPAPCADYTPVGQSQGPLYDSFYTGSAGDITNLELILSAAADSGSFQVGLFADTSASTPEPASSLLVAAGIGVLALLLRATARRTHRLT
jgi:hypothetical protein